MTWLAGLFLVIFIGSAAISGLVQGVPDTGTPPPTTTSADTAPAQVTGPTGAPSVPQYPPKTKADLLSLAAQGDVSAIPPFHSESVGLTGVCPQPKVLVTVDLHLTGKRLAEDLLAFFYQNHYDNPCGAVVFAYHTQAEANGDGYTAGHILLDTTAPDGSSITDPNASEVNYTLTLDTGSALGSEQGYTVSY